MEKISQLVLPFCLIIVSVYGQDSDYCYARDKTPYELFSTLTSYDAVKGSATIETGCKPLYVWSLIKHGVRQLTDKEIERNVYLNELKADIEKNNNEKRCALCWDDYQNIHNSKDSRLNKDQDENLKKKAISNHELFAAYLGNFIDSSQQLTKDNFEFKVSNAKGARDSAVKFANQLLRTSYEDTTGNGITENSTLLKSKGDCEKWTPNTKETESFVSSPYFQKTIMEITARLGFTQPLPCEKIVAMYESCTFGNVLPATQKPPFCAAFTPNDLKVIEYMLDLKHYYEFGYGNALSEKMGCQLVKDMITKLDKASSSNDKKLKGTFYFADSENEMGFLTKLSMYRDENPPNADNYQSMKETRKWRSSFMDPYTATIHAVLFNCGNNNEKRVELYHNQNLIKLEPCKNTNKCPLDTFITEIKRISRDENCDDKFCGNPSASGSSVVNYSFIVTILGFLFSRL